MHQPLRLRSTLLYLKFFEFAIEAIFFVTPKAQKSKTQKSNA